MVQPAETVFRGSQEALSCVLFGSVASAFLALSKMMIQTLSKAICQPAEARFWMVARFGILVHSRRPESLNHYKRGYCKRFCRHQDQTDERNLVASNDAKN